MLLHKLDHHVRAELDTNARRSLAVLRPLRLVLTNLSADHCVNVHAKVRKGCATSPCGKIVTS